MICFLEAATQRAAAFREAHRVLKPGGVAIFTTLMLEERRHSALHRALLRYLQWLRRIRGSQRNAQCLPWLRLGGQWNWTALADGPPHNYWYRVEEFSQDLQAAGFSVEAMATDHQIKEKRLCASAKVLATEPLAGILYAVCRK
jgi:ubiquinone/menaquinone biosynthesis C-methylase UbiE